MKSRKKKEAVDLEELSNFYTGYRTAKLSHKPHIRKYNRARALHFQTLNECQDYLEESGYDLPRSEKYIKGLLDKAPVTGTWGRVIKSSYDMETKSGTHAAFEILIYGSDPSYKGSAEILAEKKGINDQEKLRMLKSMQDSVAGLFEVVEVDEEDAYVHLKEVFTGREFKSIDIAMTNTTNALHLYMFLRIITFRNQSFGTGLNIPFRKTDPFIVSYIDEQKKSVAPVDNYIMVSELYNQYTQDADHVKYFTNTFTE